MMTTMRRPRFRMVLLGLVAVLGLAALAACGDDDAASNGDGNGDEGAFDVQPANGDDESAQEGPGAQGFMGAGVNPPIPKPDMTLTDTNGEDFNIQEETEGYVTLLYFGYTNCPDACPTHMQDVTATLEDMSEEQREQVKVLFVTTDIETDTPERLREWLDLFNEDFIGLTGTQEQIDELQRSVGIAPTDEPATHAAYVMAFTAETNTAPLVYPSGVTREMWLNDMTKLVEEGYSEG